MKRNQKNDGNTLYATKLFIHACQKVVSTGGRFENYFSPYNPYEYYVNENYSNAAFEIEGLIIEEFIESKFRDQKYDLVWLNLACDICGTELMGLCEWDDEGNFVEPIAFGCAKCGYTEKAKDAVKILLEDRITVNKNEKNINNSVSVEDRKYF